MDDVALGIQDRRYLAYFRSRGRWRLAWLAPYLVLAPAVVSAPRAFGEAPAPPVEAHATVAFDAKVPPPLSSRVLVRVSAEAARAGSSYSWAPEGMQAAVPLGALAESGLIELVRRHAAVAATADVADTEIRSSVTVARCDAAETSVTCTVAVRLEIALLPKGLIVGGVNAEGKASVAAPGPVDPKWNPRKKYAAVLEWTSRALGNAYVAALRKLDPALNERRAVIALSVERVRSLFEEGVTSAIKTGACDELKKSKSTGSVIPALSQLDAGGCGMAPGLTLCLAGFVSAGILSSSDAVGWRTRAIDAAIASCSPPPLAPQAPAWAAVERATGLHLVNLVTGQSRLLQAGAPVAAMTRDETGNSLYYLIRPSFEVYRARVEDATAQRLGALEISGQDVRVVAMAGSGTSVAVKVEVAARKGRESRVVQLGAEGEKLAQTVRSEDRSFPTAVGGGPSGQWTPETIGELWYAGRIERDGRPQAPIPLGAASRVRPVVLSAAAEAAVPYEQNLTGLLAHARRLVEGGQIAEAEDLDAHVRALGKESDIAQRVAAVDALRQQATQAAVADAWESLRIVQAEARAAEQKALAERRAAAMKYIVEARKHVAKNHLQPARDDIERARKLMPGLPEAYAVDNEIQEKIAAKETDAARRKEALERARKLAKAQHYLNECRTSVELYKAAQRAEQHGIHARQVKAIMAARKAKERAQESFTKARTGLREVFGIYQSMGNAAAAQALRSAAGRCM